MAWVCPIEPSLPWNIQSTTTLRWNGWVFDIISTRLCISSLFHLKSPNAHYVCLLAAVRNFLPHLLKTASSSQKVSGTKSAESRSEYAAESVCLAQFGSPAEFDGSVEAADIDAMTSTTLNRCPDKVAY